MKLYSILLIFLFVTKNVSAQDVTLRTLTLDEAINLALQNNKQIQIQTKETTIAKNNVYLGNAGLLPTVNLIGSGEYSNNQQDVNIRTFQPNPPIISFNENGVSSQTVAAVVQADYQILGGFAGKYRYRLLQNQSSIAGLQQRVLINNTIVGITEIFIQIAKLQSREELLSESILITKKRLEKANDNKQFGQGTGLDVLRAETDLNKETSSLDDIILVKSNLIKELNRLIGLESDAFFRVNVNYTLPKSLEASNIIEQVKSNNPAIQLAKQGLDFANNQIGLARSEYLPKMNLFANYGYFNQKNDIQQLAEVQNLGFVVGGSIRLNIFNGSKNRKDVLNAKINIEKQELTVSDVEQQFVTAASQELNSLNILEKQLLRETSNLATFEETFNRTQDRYYNGQATNLDLRDTQTALLDAKIAINEIKLKMIESTIRLNSLKGVVLQ
jgi:outer membrane protein TolC